MATSSFESPKANGGSGGGSNNGTYGRTVEKKSAGTKQRQQWRAVGTGVRPRGGGGGGASSSSKKKKKKKALPAAGNCAGGGGGGGGKREKNSDKMVPKSSSRHRIRPSPSSGGDRSTRARPRPSAAASTASSSTTAWGGGRRGGASDAAGSWSGGDRRRRRRLPAAAGGGAADDAASGGGDGGPASGRRPAWSPFRMRLPAGGCDRAAAPPPWWRDGESSDATETNARATTATATATTATANSLAAGGGATATAPSPPSSHPSSSTSSRFSSPPGGGDGMMLRIIDDELRSLASYVGLTGSERSARAAFVEHVAELCRGLFFPKGTPSGVLVAPFGSYATPEVCTFESDVDMCLWGVVDGVSSTPPSTPPPSSTATTTAATVARNGDGDGDGGDDDDDCDDCDDDRRGGGGAGCPLLTESALLRTMDAIQAAAAAAAAAAGGFGGNGGRGGIASAGAAASSTSVASEPNDRNGKRAIIRRQEKRGRKKAKKRRPSSSADDGNAGDVDDGLFFIDRAGEAAAAAMAPGFNLPESDDEDSKRGVADVVEIIDLSNDDDDAAAAISAAAIAATAGGDDIIDGRYALATVCNELDHSDPVGEEDVTETNTDSAATDDATAVAAATAAVSNSTEDFQFVIGEEGMKELGGDNDDDEEVVVAAVVVDLSKSDTCADDNDAPAAARQADSGQVEGEETFSSYDIIAVNSDGEDDDGDDDSADKLSSYYQSHDKFDATASDRNDHRMDVRGRASTSSSVILLDRDDSSEEKEYLGYESSSDSSDDDECREFMSGCNTTSLELSITSNKSNDTDVRAEPAVVGPRGKARTRVISALLILTRQLRMSSKFTHTIECRTKARVPIINCSTRMGFEGDIAIGGHNGVDTSMYAMSQVKRFRSFSSVVLLLKLVMAQQGLDKPFTGGLGSYKLYVLVAYHIERHLANGGNDRPSEILLSLLVRYGLKGSNRGRDTTDLEQLRNRDGVLHCDGGVVDLTPVFRLSDCVDMFRECHDRILKADIGEENIKTSFLSSIIDCFRLREARETSDRRSKMVDNTVRPPIARSDPGKVIGGRSVGAVSYKSDAQKGYKRGPRGGIVPKIRPDLAAKDYLKGSCYGEIIQRAMKNRKNKKKQTRDAPFKKLASRRSI